MTETESDVWTVIVTFNASAVIGDCLRSLRNSTYVTNVIVVDNGSSDSTVDIVQSAHVPVLLLRMGENLGFAGGCNRGIERAIADGARFVFLLNPDAQVDPDCVLRLRQTLESDSLLGIACPLIRDTRTGLILYAGARLNVARMEFRTVAYGDREVPPNLPRSTDRPHGAVMLVRVSAIDSVGLLDESYFLYWEESEWALRLSKAGFGIAIEPLATALHAESHSTGGPSSRIYEYYFARNMLHFVSTSSGFGKVKTSQLAVPIFGRRLFYNGRDYGLRAAVRTAHFICLGYVDFWRGRRGMRAQLHTPTRGSQ